MMLRTVSVSFFLASTLMLAPLEGLMAQERANLSLFQNTRYLGTALVSEDSNSSQKPKQVLIEVIPILENGKVSLHFTRIEEESSGERFYPSTYLLQKPVEAKLTNQAGTFSAEFPPVVDALIPAVTVDGNLDQEKGEISHLRIELNDHKGAFVMKSDKLQALELTGYEGIGVIQTDYKHSRGEISSSAARLIPLLIEANTRKDRMDFIIKTDPSLSNSTFSVYNKKISAKIDQDRFEGRSEDSSLSISGKLSPDRSKIEGVKIQMISGHETYRISGPNLSRLEERPIFRAKQIVESIRLEPEPCSSVQAIPKRAP